MLFSKNCSSFWPAWDDHHCRTPLPSPAGLTLFRGKARLPRLTTRTGRLSKATVQRFHVGLGERPVEDGDLVQTSFP